MTKMKSKKMTKSTFAIIIMAIAMVAMLAFGGTYAYFTATAQGNTKNEIMTAVVEITNSTTNDQITVTTNTALLPGDSIFGTHELNTETGKYEAKTYEEIVLKNKSTAATYVFVSFEAATLIDTTKTALFVNIEGKPSVLVSDIKGLGTTWKAVIKDGATVAYYLPVAAIAGTTAEDVKFEFAVRLHEGIQAQRAEQADDSVEETTNVVDDENAAADIMGVNVEVKISVSAIQQKGYTETNILAAYENSKLAVDTDAATRS